MSRRTLTGLVTTFLLASVIGAAAALTAAEAKRIEEAAAVLKEIHAAPDKDIPNELWERAACVMIVPSIKKGALVFGGEYGKGLMSCRHNGAWSAPVFMEIEKGSWGLQIGAQSIDLVLLVMNEKGAQKLLRNKVSLGAEASIAGGPVGRDARAATDAQMKAEILSYSRTQGLFAGVNLSGGSVRPDKDGNSHLYGPNATPSSIVTGANVKAPAETAPLMAALNRRR